MKKDKRTGRTNPESPPEVKVDPAIPASNPAKSRQSKLTTDQKGNKASQGKPSSSSSKAKNTSNSKGSKTAHKTSGSSKVSKTTSSSKPNNAANSANVDVVLSQAYQLTSHELTQLIEGLNQLKEARDAQLDEDEWYEQEDQEFERQRQRQGRSPRIEAKIINGCGPYDYLRWWNGKTYKSTYLGKSKG
jgi:hypothetical protein